jgi:hypothetical protein
MTKKAWDILITVAALAFEVLILIKDKLTGGKHDNSSRSAKA